MTNTDKILTGKKRWEKESEVEWDLLAVTGLTDIQPQSKKSLAAKNTLKASYVGYNISNKNRAGRWACSISKGKKKCTPALVPGLQYLESKHSTNNSIAARCHRM